MRKNTFLIQRNTRKICATEFKNVTVYVLQGMGLSAKGLSSVEEPYFIVPTHLLTYQDQWGGLNTGALFKRCNKSGSRVQKIIGLVSSTHKCLNDYSQLNCQGYTKMEVNILQGYDKQGHNSWKSHMEK